MQELAHRGQGDDDVAGGELGAGPDEGWGQSVGYVTMVAQAQEFGGPDRCYADDTLWVNPV